MAASAPVATVSGAARPEGRTPRTAPAGTGTSKLRAFFELTKPGITLYVLFTAAAGYLAAVAAHGGWGSPGLEGAGAAGPGARLFVLLAGTALAAGGTNALNQWRERELDAKMRRTRGRPLPSGRLGAAEALLFSLAISAAGTAVLALWVNALTAGLAAATLLLYVLVYTPLKRVGPAALEVGAVPGALPILGGWTAATGAPEAGGLALCLVLFLWQMPHFLGLGWLAREDYRRGGFRLVGGPDADGRGLRGRALLYTALLVPAAHLPLAAGAASGAVYVFGTLALGGAFLACAAAFARAPDDRSARRLFLGSIAYLPAFLALLVLSPGPAAALAAEPDAALGTEPEAGLRLYVPNQMGASVSVVDGGGSVLATVDLRAHGFSEHAMPHQVAAEPDGSAWYATLAGDGYVVKFNARNELAARTRFEAPGMVVLDPARDRLYVSRSLSAVNPPTSLGVFRALDLTLLEEVEIFVPRAHGLAVDTVSGRVYAASLAAGLIATLEPARGDVFVTHAADAPSGFVGLAVSPDGRILVATTQINDRLLAFDAADGGELPQVASLDVKAGPYDVAFAPDGASVWFPNQRAHAVTRVDVATWTVAATLRHEAFQEPHGLVFAPDGSTLYVTSHGWGVPDAAEAGDGADGVLSPAVPTHRAGSWGNGTVAVIDPTTDELRVSVEVGPYAAAPGLGSERPAGSR